MVSRSSFLVVFLLLFFIVGCQSSSKDKDESALVINDSFIVKANESIELKIFSKHVDNLTLVQQSALGASIEIQNENIKYTAPKNLYGNDVFVLSYGKADNKQLVTVNLQVHALAITKLSVSSYFSNLQPLQIDIQLDGTIIETTELLAKFEATNEKNDGAALKITELNIGDKSVSVSIDIEENSSTPSPINVDFLLTIPLIDGSPIEISADYYHIPEMNSLNWPQRSIFTGNYLKNLLETEKKIDFYWLNLGKWQVPSVLEWNEDPFSNISWQLYFHSLGWLTTYGEVYKKTADSKYLEAVESFLVSYNETFSGDEKTTSSVAYREDAVALRMNHLIYFHLELGKHLSINAQKALDDLLSKNVERLKVYLSDEEYHDDNHGMIQARSALNYVAVFPFKEDANVVFDNVLNRLEQASALMFDGDSGLNVEQSIDYHYIGLSMFLEAKSQLESLNLEVPQTLIDTISKAILAGAYLQYQDGSVPAIGDTYFDNNWRYYLGRYYEIYDRKVAEMEEFLTNGQSALDSLKAFEKQGLVVMKEQHSQEVSSKVFFDAGPKRNVHGHHDNLNVTASINNNKLLVDSAGPYVYSYKGRQNFQSLYAHNTIVVNEIETNNYDAELKSYNEQPKYIVTSGAQKVNDEIVHKRAVVLTKEIEPILIVVDNVLNEKQSSMKIEQVWHFPPKVILDEINLSVQHDNGTTTKIRKLVNDKSSCHLIKGEYDSDNVPYLGWITREYNKVEQAPVLNCNNSYHGVFNEVTVFANENKILNSSLISQNEEEIVFSVNNTVYRFDLTAGLLTTH